MEPLTQSDRTAADNANRRSDPRHAVAGKVRLKFEQPLQKELEVDLLDVSASGFRAKHRQGVLPLGAKAAFRHSEAAGKAQVVWNWVFPDRVETGFVILR